MRPWSNTEREWSATQRERTKCVVGRGQSTIDVGFAHGDWEQSERAIDAPSLSGFVVRMRERATTRQGACA